MAEGGSKSQDDFINEYARTRLVLWCEYEVTKTLGYHLEADTPSIVEYAIKKGWLTTRQPRRVTTSGFSVAAAYLRR